MSTRNPIVGIERALSCVFFLLLTLPSPINAQQDKEVPPPTSLETDTAKVRPDSSKRQPTIQLPDVIIYGKDLDKQTGGEKLPALEMETPIPPSGAVGAKTEAMIAPGKEVSTMGLAMKSLIGSAYAQYGRFDTWGIGGSLAGQTQNLDHNLAIDYWRSHGHIEGAHHHGMRLRTGGGYRASPRLRLSAFGGYESRKFGLYGLSVSDSRRDIFRLRFQGGLMARPWDGVTTTGLLSYLRAGAEDMPLHQEVTEDLWRGDLKAEARIEKFQILASGSWLGDFVEDSLSSEDHLISLEARGLWHATPRLSIQAGARYQSLSRREKSTQERLFPLGRVTYHPREELGLSVALSGEYSHRPLERAVATNSFLDLGVGSQVEEVRVWLEGEVEYRPVEKLWTRYRIIHRHVKGWLAWEDQDLDTLFELRSFPEVRELRGSVELEFRPHSDLSATIGITLKDQDVTDAPDESLTYRVPYEEKIDANGNVSYLLPWNICGTVTGEYHGERFTHWTSGSKTPDYGLLNLRLERGIGRHFTLSIAGHNVTDSRYEVWPGYREPGITASAGVRMRW